MSLFASDRERRLWLWTAIVLVAIYSTLGLARTLSDELRARELFGAFFVIGLLMIATAVVLLALNKPPGGAQIGVGLGVAASYLLVFTRMGLETERSHLIEYGLVAVLIYEALKERANHGHHVPIPAVLAIVATALLGWLDEGIQALIPNRVYDLQDVGFNALAAFMAVAASLALSRAGQRRGN